METPRDYGLSHDHFRKGQLGTIKWIAGNKSEVMFVEAPVGSGKSAVGVALGKYGLSRILTQRLDLQEQYVDEYGIETVFGMNNYDCALHSLIEMKADSCVYIENMTKCPVSSACDYLNARRRASQSNIHVLSYAYYLKSMQSPSSWVSAKPADFLYMDEGHLLPALVRGHSAIDMTPDMLRVLDVPMYPTVNISNDSIRLMKAINWLKGVRTRVIEEHTELMKLPEAYRTKNLKISKRIRMLNDRIQHFNRVIRQATLHKSEFFADWNDERIRILPLTARHFFPELFLQKGNKKVIMTSATIGNTDVLAQELGIKHFDSRVVPSNFSVESQPILLMKDAPRMNARSGESEKNKQADLIAACIKDNNPMWSGIIHVSSRKQAADMAERLARRGLQNRVFIPSARGTLRKIAEWERRVRRTPNTIAISYSFHEGLDAREVKMNFVAKIPFRALDKPGMAELKRNPKLYSWNAAVKLEQACGRTRRGFPEHYEAPGMPTRKVVAIADMNYSRVKPQLSPFFKSCVIEH